MQINADLHLHSKYSMASSPKMELPTIAIEAAKKGIDFVATSDCIHPKWLLEIKQAAVDDETIRINNTDFVLTTEIEDKNRVHHLLILPSISKAEELAEVMGKYGNLAADGRPTIRLDGVDIAEAAKDVGALLGPAHAFTPWTALYAAHNSLKDCYGDMTDYISFVELGLSADSDYADRIKELQRLTFLSNSDAHSPWPDKLAREFTRFEVPEVTFDGLKKAILRKSGYKSILNVGFYPQEGKYNKSACIKCFKNYTLDECLSNNWRCSCGGRVKKGVEDRINELSDFSEPIHPKYRPEYTHIIPLAEIIMMAVGHSSTSTKGVQTPWNLLIERFGNEVAVLLKADPAGLKIVDQKIVDAILAFRHNEVILHPGGGGKYGWIELPQSDKMKKPENSDMQKQKSLVDY